MNYFLHIFLLSDTQQGKCFYLLLFFYNEIRVILIIVYHFDCCVIKVGMQRCCSSICSATATKIAFSVLLFHPLLWMTGEDWSRKTLTCARYMMMIWCKWSQRKDGEQEWNHFYEWAIYYIVLSNYIFWLYHKQCTATNNIVFIY